MKPSSSELIAAVADTIENSVLPAMNPADWTSSRLRSSLLILKHLEKRVVLEQALLQEDNESFQQMLAEAKEMLLENAPKIAELIDVTALSASSENADALNETYNATTDQVLRELYRCRSSLDREIFDKARLRIRSCLTESQDRMSPLFERLGKYSIL